MTLAAPGTVGVPRRARSFAEVGRRTWSSADTLTQLLQAARVARFLVGTVAVFSLTLAGGLAVLAVIPRVLSDWETVIVTSGSMAPAIRPGDVVVARPTGNDSVPAGSVVVFADAGRAGALVTHRVTRVDEHGSLVTKGDANQSPDQTPIDPDRVVGVGRLVVPSIAAPVLRVRQGQWGAGLAYAAAVVGCLYAARFGVHARYDPWAAP